MGEEASDRHSGTVQLDNATTVTLETELGILSGQLAYTDPDEALKRVEVLLGSARASGDRIAMMLTLRAKSIVHAALSDPGSATASLEEAFEIMVATDSPKIRAALHIAMARRRYYNGQAGSVKQLLEEAFRLNILEPCLDTELDIELMSSRLLFQEGDSRKGQEVFLNILEKVRPIQDDFLLYRCLVGYGAWLSPFFDEILEIAERNNFHRLTLARIYGNASEQAARRGNYLEAVALTEKAQAIFTPALRQHYKTSMFQLVTQIAQAGDLERAALLAIEHHDMLVEEKARITTLYHLLGEYFVPKDPHRAISFLTQALSALEERLRPQAFVGNLLGNHSEVACLHGHLADAYRELGDEAMRTHHLQIRGDEYAKSATNADHPEMLIGDFYGRYARLLDEREAARTERADALSRLQSQLEQSANHRAKLDEFSREVLHALDEATRNGGSLNTAVKLVKDLTQGFEWRAFYEQFAAAHPDFDKKLLARCPEISNSELRVAAIIRMGLKSDEIARLLSVSERTVESHRFWIRKKLGLQKGEDLSAYLSLL